MKIPEWETNGLASDPESSKARQKADYNDHFNVKEKRIKKEATPGRGAASRIHRERQQPTRQQPPRAAAPRPPPAKQQAAGQSRDEAANSMPEQAANDSQDRAAHSMPEQAAAQSQDQIPGSNLPGEAAGLLSDQAAGAQPNQATPYAQEEAASPSSAQHEDGSTQGYHAGGPASSQLLISPVLPSSSLPSGQNTAEESPAKPQHLQEDADRDNAGQNPNISNADDDESRMQSVQRPRKKQTARKSTSYRPMQLPEQLIANASRGGGQENHLPPSHPPPTLPNEASWRRGPNHFQPLRTQPTIRRHPTGFGEATASDAQPHKEQQPDKNKQEDKGQSQEHNKGGDAEGNDHAARPLPLPQRYTAARKFATEVPRLLTRGAINRALAENPREPPARHPPPPPRRGRIKQACRKNIRCPPTGWTSSDDSDRERSGDEDGCANGKQFGNDSDSDSDGGGGGKGQPTKGWPAGNKRQRDSDDDDTSEESGEESSEEDSGVLCTLSPLVNALRMNPGACRNCA